jgi:hypothetical protein
MNYFLCIIIKKRNLSKEKKVTTQKPQADSNLFMGAQRYALRLKTGDYGGNAPVIPHFQRMRSIHTPSNNSLPRRQLCLPPV